MDANRQNFASARRDGGRPRVLVTRPEPDASVFAAIIRAAGMTPVLSPAMEIVFRPQPVSLDGVGALAFTSANGVRALQRAALPAAALALPVFAVGPASGETASRAGFRNVFTADGDVASLAALIRRSFSDRVVLHVSGSNLAGDLDGLLTATGIGMRRAVLYAAEPSPDLSAAAKEMLSEATDKDWVTFFSPRTARLFIEQAQASGMADCLKAMGAACLSDSIADAARNVAWAQVRVAEKASGEAMVAMMARENPSVRS